MAESTDPAELYSVLWQSGRRPDLDTFLASTGPLTARQLADLVCTDQRERWRAGDQVRVEAYFERFPQLRADPGLALDLVYAEVLLHGGEGAGGELNLSRRFPDLAPALKIQLDLHRALVPPAPPDGAEPIPVRFGRYEVRRQLGRGGMGAVYLAHDTQLNRLVALKVPLLDGDPAHGRQFVREARAAAALQHPNICPVYDYGEVGGRHFITMAYLDGEPLSARVARGPLPPVEAARLVRTLADALDEAHRAGIVHRDLKPSNVLFNSKGQPVVTDFGLARQLNPTSLDSHSGRMLVGTPNYMAPEQVNGQAGAVGPATDIYALGVVLYELLTGARPFDGPLGALLARITTEDPPAPSRVRPQVDARLSAICLKAMAKDPADRYPSMAAFAVDLDAWLAAGPDPRLDRRPARWVALGAGGVVAAALAAGLLAWRPWKSESESGGAPAPNTGPPAVAARDPAGARARADEAWRQNDRGEFDRAIELSTAALALDDRCVGALLCRANARIKTGDPRAAVADLNRAVEIDPTNHEPEVDLAWAYNELNDHAAALDHADRALMHKKDSVEAYCQRGEAHRRLGKPREALADLDEAIRIDREYENAYRERAAVYTDLGEEAKARMDETKADELRRRKIND